MKFKSLLPAISVPLSSPADRPSISFFSFSDVLFPLYLLLHRPFMSLSPLIPGILGPRFLSLQSPLLRYRGVLDLVTICGIITLAARRSTTSVDLSFIFVFGVRDRTIRRRSPPSPSSKSQWNGQQSFLCLFV